MEPAYYTTKIYNPNISEVLICDSILANYVFYSQEDIIKIQNIL